MLAFGAGTLPSMLGAGLVLQGAGRRLVGPGNWQRIAGALLLAFGLWTAGNAVWHARGGAVDHEHHRHHGQAGSSGARRRTGDSGLSDAATTASTPSVSRRACRRRHCSTQPWTRSS